MNEKVIKEALKRVVEGTELPKEEPETMVPKDREHLTENKKKLNEELLRRWGYAKKDGRKVI